MKATFHHLPADKRQKVIDSCIEEFSVYGYDKGSTDRIIKLSGISKGGLYEYIDSKEDLYLFIVEHCYNRLYDYIRSGMERQGKGFPKDILERFTAVYAVAIGFYLEHPGMIGFIAKTAAITDPALKEKVQAIFLKSYTSLFGDTETKTLAFSQQQILGLLQWLLSRTRNDFLEEVGRSADVERIKKNYFDDWAFFIEVLRNGIYKKQEK